MDLNHLNLRVRDPVACRGFYEAYFGFRLTFEADGGYFVTNDDGFLLALIPVAEHQPLPDGFHVGFGVSTADHVLSLHEVLCAAEVPIRDIEDSRPSEEYVTFRCWDPDGTEIEVFWQGP